MCVFVSALCYLDYSLALSHAYTCVVEYGRNGRYICRGGGGGEPFLTMYLWWSLCTLHLLPCQVLVTEDDSGLCRCIPCYTCDVYGALVHQLPL